MKLLPTLQENWAPMAFADVSLFSSPIGRSPTQGKIPARFKTPPKRREFAPSGYERSHPHSAIQSSWTSSPDSGRFHSPVFKRRETVQKYTAKTLSSVSSRLMSPTISSLKKDKLFGNQPIGSSGLAGHPSQRETTNTGTETRPEHSNERAEADCCSANQSETGLGSRHSSVESHRIEQSAIVAVGGSESPKRSKTPFVIVSAEEGLEREFSLREVGGEAEEGKLRERSGGTGEGQETRDGERKFGSVDNIKVASASGKSFDSHNESRKGLRLSDFSEIVANSSESRGNGSSSSRTGSPSNLRLSTTTESSSLSPHTVELEASKIASSLPGSLDQTEWETPRKKTPNFDEDAFPQSDPKVLLISLQSGTPNGASAVTNHEQSRATDGNGLTAENVSNSSAGSWLVRDNPTAEFVKIKEEKGVLEIQSGEIAQRVTRDSVLLSLMDSNVDTPTNRMITPGNVSESEEWGIEDSDSEDDRNVFFGSALKKKLPRSFAWRLMMGFFHILSNVLEFGAFVSLSCIVVFLVSLIIVAVVREDNVESLLPT